MTLLIYDYTTISLYYYLHALLYYSDKKYKWVHLWTGKEVPPTSGGSFNHLINDILKQNLDHLLICQYSAESYRLAESSKASIIYVEFKSKVTFKSRMKHRLTGAHPINYEDFLKNLHLLQVFQLS